MVLWNTSNERQGRNQEQSDDDVDPSLNVARVSGTSEGGCGHQQALYVRRAEARNRLDRHSRSMRGGRMPKSNYQVSNCGVAVRNLG